MFRRLGWGAGVKGGRADRRDGRSALGLAAAGLVATAISFGPARMGFGLFLPRFSDAFTLSDTQAGLISGSGFSGFLGALVMTVWLTDRFGPRLPITMGVLFAAAGFLLVAVAQTPLALAAGITLAGASAGFCWTPFNDAAECALSEAKRAHVLSAVSTGTAIGVAIAGALALWVSASGVSWRSAWAIFAVAGLIAVPVIWRAVPARRPPHRNASAAALSLFPKAAGPLYSAATCFGLVNAVFLSFAADHVATSRAPLWLPDWTVAGVIFVSYGLCGLVGLATGRIEARLGSDRLLAAIFAAFASSLILIALTPGTWPGVPVAAGLHGAAVMTISALLSFWSLRLFPGRGSLGFTATLIWVAAGSIAGPVMAGVLADLIGLTSALFAISVIPFAAMVFFVHQAGRNL